MRWLEDVKEDEEDERVWKERRELYRMDENSKEEGTKNFLASSSAKPFMPPTSPPSPSFLFIITTMIQLITSSSLAPSQVHRGKLR